MKTQLHKASTRGYFNHGWLQTHHTFSFAAYHNPARVHFGALRVLNDDTIAPGQGFDTHPHREMEIITIPIRGAVAHKDSMGYSSVIHAGEMQVMSAGHGITHSEYNPSTEEQTELLQIWIFTDYSSDEPRYENGTISDKLLADELSVVVSPYPGENDGLWIRQQAWILLGELDQGKTIEYTFRSADSYGVYFFVIDGEIAIADTILNARDGLGVTEASHCTLKVRKKSVILAVEVPNV